MLSLQNAKSSRNRVLAVRFAVIMMLCAALLMISAISTTRVRAQNRLAPSKFLRVGKPIPNQYIVVLNDNVPGSEVALRAGEMTRPLGANIGHIYRSTLKGFSATMSEAAAIALSLDPQVEFVEEDGVASVGTTQTNPGWGLDRTDQANLPLDLAYTYNETGTGVNAYIIDTGVRTTHQDFGGRAFFATDTVGDGQNGTDCFGHGTSVASLVGGSTYGIAKNVTIYNVRVCDCNGSCAHSNWIAGIDWVTSNHDKTKPAVANQSLGTVGGPSTAIDKAVRKSIASGVTHVVCAKNSNVDASNVSPARTLQVITVGATGDDLGTNPVSDQRASFSNFGSVLDLFAPGVKTPAASPFSDTAADPNFGGTSASSPHVAGAVARYLQTDPTACPSTVSDVITGVATSGVVINPGTGSPNKLLFTPLSWSAPTYYSLSLNGTSAYADVPNAGLGVSFDITGPITVEAWIRLSAVPTGASGIVERYMDLTTAEGGFALRLSSGRKLKFYSLINGFNYDVVTGGTVLATNTWYHVAGVFTGTELKVYVGGALDGSKSSTFAPGTGTSDIFIGRQAPGSGFFNGLIDEARVTADVVYTTNFIPKNRLTGLPGTKGLWRFDRQNVRDCADIHNGSLVGGATFSTTVP